MFRRIDIPEKRSTDPLSELFPRASEYFAKLEAYKAKNPLGGPGWYGYSISANLTHITKLLSQQNRDVFQTQRDLPVADIGAADGDLGFYFDQQGYSVDLIDVAHANWNKMAGIRHLKKHFSSHARVHDIDLDAQFHLPRDRYGIIFFLGILYHLKNPFYALEQLAAHANYCFLSTRIARYTERGREMTGEPFAYLLNPAESNNDSTNFWIFSEAGLRRLCSRTGWEIIDFITVGDQKNSSVAASNRDERAFALLKSHTFS
jgi:2-polyprenyl-3-methyl-5-hydroxy-6-metoxy-1,4-benzoquinol methylase